MKKNVTSNKIKHVLVENKLNALSEKVKAILSVGLTKDLINKFSILIGGKFFSPGIFQNYLIFIPAGILNILVVLLGLIHGNLMECQEKILKI